MRSGLQRGLHHLSRGLHLSGVYALRWRHLRFELRQRNLRTGLRRGL